MDYREGSSYQRDFCLHPPEKLKVDFSHDDICTLTPMSVRNSKRFFNINHLITKKSRQVLPEEISAAMEE